MTPGEKLSVYYHDIFDFPLSLQDIIKWKASDALKISRELPITSQSGYFYVEGKEGLIYKRLLRKRISAKKMQIAKRSAGVLCLIPGIKMVGVTGSLAMQNSAEDSDVDLMVITKTNSLWITRLSAYFVLRVLNYATRQPKNNQQKDRLCLNIWLAENDLVWNKTDRNLYTAHEIAQIIPLINKDKTYEKFLLKNKWVLKYWPNSVKITDNKLRTRNYAGKPLNTILNAPSMLMEKFAYRLQRKYMKSKITREVVTPTRALFHPQDWGKVILGRLSP